MRDRTHRILMTAEVAALLDVPEWRIIKFAEGREYGITPSLRDASGSGTRRLYSVDDVKQLAFALWMYGCGLRSDVIGAALKKLRAKARFETGLRPDQKEPPEIYLVVAMTPKKQISKVDAFYVRKIDELVCQLRAKPESDFVLIPVGHRLLQLIRRLREAIAL